MTKEELYSIYRNKLAKGDKKLLAKVLGYGSTTALVRFLKHNSEKELAQSQNKLVSEFLVQNNIFDAEDEVKSINATLIQEAKSNLINKVLELTGTNDYEELASILNILQHAHHIVESKIAIVRELDYIKKGDWS